MLKMNKLRIGVIGVGHLGSIHAKIYKEIDACSLVGVCDTDKSRLEAVSKELNVAGFPEYSALFDKVDAVSIASPTRYH